VQNIKLQDIKFQTILLCNTNYRFLIFNKYVSVIFFLLKQIYFIDKFFHLILHVFQLHLEFILFRIKIIHFLFNKYL